MKCGRKVAMITGSSKGLGEALAWIYAGHGYEVIVHGRSRSRVLGVCRRLRLKGFAARAVCGDINSAAVRGRLEKAARLRGLDILVNNAGEKCPGKPLASLSDLLIDRMIGTNLISVIKLTKMVLPLLVRSRGCVIMVNSRCGRHVRPKRTIYCASKWGLRGFSDALKLETQGRVRVLDAYPGSFSKEGSAFLRTGAVAQRIVDVQRKDSGNAQIVF